MYLLFPHLLRNIRKNIHPADIGCTVLDFMLYVYDYKVIYPYGSKHVTIFYFLSVVTSIDKNVTLDILRTDYTLDQYIPFTDSIKELFIAYKLYITHSKISEIIEVASLGLKRFNALFMGIKYISSMYIARDEL